MGPIDPTYGRDVPFWKPTWRDTAKHLGWRWLLFAPAVLAALGLAATAWHPRWGLWLVFGQFKLLAWVLFLPVASVGAAVQSALARRTEPFCIHCGYDLTGLGEAGVCPECGRPFTGALIDEYRRDPEAFVARHRET